MLMYNTTSKNQKINKNNVKRCYCTVGSASC